MEKREDWDRGCWNLQSLNLIGQLQGQRMGGLTFGLLLYQAMLETTLALSVLGKCWTTEVLLSQP